MRPSDIIEEAEGIANQPLTLRLITIGLEALSSRALVWVVSLGAGGLWTLAMLDPAWIKLAMATGYCLTVLVPVLVRDAKGG